MLRLVGSYELFSQGILVALVTRMGSNLRELGDTVSLEHSQLYVFCYVDICTVTVTTG
jgi:hypothetical protein